VQRKQGSHKSAPPKTPCHAPKHMKEQQGVNDMNKHVYQVMPARIESEYLDIKHVRDPRNRVPIAGMEFGESPDKTLGGQAVNDVSVLCDIAGIVIVNEIKSLHLPIDDECGDDQEKANGFSSVFMY
jgi:hypothetical protein